MRSSARLCGRSVLVVEDEALIAIGLKELFEAEGADVHIASTPQDALRLVDEIAFSAAVLDFGSAGDDKAPLCRALRAHDVAFMYYTGYDDVDEGSAGPPVVAKPATGDVLIRTIARLLNLPPQPNAPARL
jgi:DNA-binding response OmpR family regulator